MDFESFRRLLEADRSIRRFDTLRRISDDTILKLADLTRLCASGRNLQPLAYRFTTDAGQITAINRHLKWAGYLNDWEGPSSAELPAAIMVQCLDTRLTGTLLCDDGLQLQAITLGATAMGLGCCIIKSFDAGAISAILSIPEHYTPRYVVAIGYPAEKSVIETAKGGLEADIRYWRDKEGMMHVPKRRLKEILIDWHTNG